MLRFAKHPDVAFIVPSATCAWPRSSRKSQDASAPASTPKPIAVRSPWRIRVTTRWWPFRSLSPGVPLITWASSLRPTFELPPWLRSESRTVYASRVRFVDGLNRAGAPEIVSGELHRRVRGANSDHWTPNRQCRDLECLGLSCLEPVLREQRRVGNRRPHGDCGRGLHGCQPTLIRRAQGISNSCNRCAPGRAGIELRALSIRLQDGVRG